MLKFSPLTLTKVRGELWRSLLAALAMAIDRIDPRMVAQLNEGHCPDGEATVSESGQ